MIEAFPGPFECQECLHFTGTGPINLCDSVNVLYTRLGVASFYRCICMNTCWNVVSGAVIAAI